MTHDTAVSWGTALQTRRLWVQFPMVCMEFFIDLFLVAALWALGLTQPFNRNEYLEYYVGDKGGRCVGLTALPPACADCQEVWDLQSPGTTTASAGLTGIGYCCYCHYCSYLWYCWYCYYHHHHHHHHCHEPCPVLPLPFMFPILQLSPPILKALSLP